MYEYILLFLMCNISYAAHLCTPELTEGSHSKKELDGHLYLKCDISTCQNVAKVIFEKTDVNTITEWTPVFETRDTTYTALDTDGDYTLKRRNYYSVFPTYHLLYIRQFTIQDTGQWRCVLHYNDRRAESQAIDIYLVPLCTPVITEGSHSKRELGGHLYLECDISACDSVSRVVFEKTGVKQLSQWTPVFEGLYETHYAALATGEDYTLKRRSSYFSSPTYHLLYIKHLTMEDFGEWRCVLHHNHRRAESKSISIFSVDGPHLTIKRENPNGVAKHGETFTCKIDGMYTEPTFEWTVTSLTTSEKYYGNTKVCKQRDDGFWFAHNVVKLNFSSPGNNTVKCSVTTKNGDPVMDTHVAVNIKDKIWKNIYTLVACFVLVLIVIMIFIMGFVKESVRKHSRRHQGCAKESLKKYNRLPQGCVKESANKHNRLPQGMFLRSAPLQTELKDTIPMATNICSIWRANDSDHVFLGGQNNPSITVFIDAGTKINYHFLTGTSILHGLYLCNNIHMVNNYNQLSKTYSIHCVCIDQRSSDGQLIPLSTLNLSEECSTPRCMFLVDKFNVGVYSFKNRTVEVFDMKSVFHGGDDEDYNDDNTKKKPLAPLNVELIKLTGYTAHECDMIDTSRNGQIICVLSYRYSDVYMYARSGEFMTRITGGLLYDPVHIQCFNDRTIAVIDRYGQIYHFDNKLSNISTRLGENTIVKAAVFTKTEIWIIDGSDSTMIHTFKLN